MSSIQACTNQAYDTIAGNYLYLSLTPGDSIWGTDFATISDLKEPFSVNYQNLIHSMKLIDGEENNPNILKRYITANQKSSQALIEATSSSSSVNSEVPNTIYGLISSLPQLSEIKKIIDQVHFDQILNLKSDKGDHSQQRYTFFAPINESVTQGFQTWLTFNDNENYNPTPQPYTFRNMKSNLGLPDLRVRQLLKTHTLSFNLKIEDTYERKLEVYPMQEGFSFIVDGTSNIVPYLNVYQRPQYLKSYEYPLPLDRFKVLKYYEVENGSLYIIDNMFLPQLVI
jgi:hypothetical protein